MSFERTVDSRVGPLDSATRAVLFSDLLSSVDIFVASVTASMVSSDERLLSVALTELEYLLGETVHLRDIEGSLRVLGEAGPGIYQILASLGPEGLRTLLASSIEALEGYGSPEPSLVAELARLHGWRVDPGVLDHRTSASAVLLTVAAAFLKEVSSA
ncbi:hypothetical protein [Aeropyrum camini]|uniref:Uncharacterized protein n=1 Tax=Aeropyrum camini SY1 = JCM 12091 TaxID=1198449 RepID=U3TFG9_9CREN|nr:hypothetical protein [Aeropyrum camini]BAN90074.1 hypothetical protein ACAM_0605 [Aeropyrum camini SY1 = JCM 12091]